MMKLSPAAYVVHVFGGLAATSAALGRDKSTISRWRTGNGRIPGPVRPWVLEVARRKNLPITSEDLDYGRNVR